jgi:hypothetical protein
MRSVSCVARWNSGSVPLKSEACAGSVHDETE